MKKLNSTTVRVLKDLQGDINKMLSMNSNIGVVWELEKLQTQKALAKSASIIKMSIKTIK